MAGKIKTVNDMISDVRSMLDEDNRESVKDDEDILPALNRGQDYASNILARHYESPMLAHTTITTESGKKEYEIPEDAFEERLEKVEVELNQLFYPVTRIDYRDLSLYETNSTTNISYYYAMVGNKFRLLPPTGSPHQLRLWYLVDPLPLVTSQGRISRINTSNNYVIVEDIGSDISTIGDDLNNYVNIVDANSGKVKASLQILDIQDDKITFKDSSGTRADDGSTPDTRLTVLNQTIQDNISSLVDSDGNTVTIEQDDLLCVIKGTCVPFFKKPFSNFLIQYAISEIRRKLGGPADMELRVLKDLEEQVERSWVGREQSFRVTKRNDKWDLPIRRFWGKNR